MKKLPVVVIAALLAGTASFAQKSTTFVNAGKAIKGYDPVAYFTDEKAALGYDSLTLEWNKAKWFFSSQTNLDLFKKNAEKYAPQYGGYCAYGCSRGYKAPIDPQAWTIDNGKLYLNYSLDVRKEWNKNRKERIEKADMNWPTVKDKE
jgi:hypothetical protein